MTTSLYGLARAVGLLALLGLLVVMAGTIIGAAQRALTGKG